MKFTKIISIVTVSLLVIGLTGCGVSQQSYDSLKLKNTTQEQRIAELESEVSSLRMQHDQLLDELEQARNIGDVDVKSMQEEITALEKAIASKNSLIEKMQKQLMSAGAPLPMELNVKLTEFAAENPDLVSFNEETGMLKFKSDLLFASGSAEVQQDAVTALEKLADIIKSPEANDFDVVVAGHTDDVRIAKPSTKKKHPTNWHLSVHRAVGVVQVLQKQGIDPERLSARGFGEYRPIEPNKAGNKGNAANRRVEIFIVPKGM